MITKCSYCKLLQVPCGIIVIGINCSRRCCADCWDDASENMDDIIREDFPRYSYSTLGRARIYDDDNPWSDLVVRQFEDRYDGLESMDEEYSDDS